jgi:hypothetical protein
LPKDLQQILSATLEERDWRRTFDFEHKEELTLLKAKRELGVRVIAFPGDVKAKLKDAPHLEHDQEKHVPAKAGMDTGFPEKSCENK